MHTQFDPRSFALSTCEGSARSLVTNDQLEVSPFARRDDIAIPIRSVTERHLLSPVSSACHPVSVPCGRACLRTERRDVGFTMLDLSDTNGLAPASTPAV